MINAKKETKKELKKDENLINATFLDKHGEITKVSDIVGKNNCWFLKTANKWILSHDAIKTIARKAGISMNFEVEESSNIIPDYRNELEHIVRVTIHCKADAPKEFKKEKNEEEPCVHSDERKITVTGEANMKSAPNRGRSYLRKMAEKRAFDIAVLEHLNLYSTIFSEEESQDFENKNEKEPILFPGSKEFEAITIEINAIINAVTIEELEKIARKIKAGKKKDKYVDKQLKFLKDLWKKTYAERKSEIF